MGNKVGDVGVDALVHWWPSESRSLHSLTSLDLSGNDITDLGAGKLFGVDFDKLAPKLNFLSLSSNTISHTGIEVIAKKRLPLLLPGCKDLQSLLMRTEILPGEMSGFRDFRDLCATILLSV